MRGDLVLLSFRSLEAAVTATEEDEMQFSKKKNLALQIDQPGNFQASRRDWLDAMVPSPQLEKRRY